MSSYDRTYEERRTMAAIFPDSRTARLALTELDHAGFRNVGFAIADAGRPLREPLVAQGLTEDEALRIEAMLEPGQAVVTVNGYDYADKATNILIDGGGRIAGPTAPARRLMPAHEAVAGDRRAHETQ